MALTADLESPEALRTRLALLVRLRWLGLVFGALQVTVYDAQPYPAGLQETGYATLATLAVLNGVLRRVTRRAPPHDLDRLALATLAVDLLGVAGIVTLYAFDAGSALFVLLVIVPVEAAMLFSLRGAMVGWAAVMVAYAVRELYATTLGVPWQTTSYTFRMGLLGLVALMVGLLARDLQRQRRAAADALAQVQQADAWRSRLVSMLGHDLRSPLAGARSGMATLREHHERLGPEDTVRILDGSIRQIDRMLVMTADLLDLARAQDARLELQLRPVRLAAVVQRAVDLTGETEVVVDVPGDLEVVGDPDRLEQVLANLLSNAQRHGAPPVEITAGRAGAHVRLVVRDHGPGVAPELRDRVFEPFATSETGGAGAGLGSWVIAHIVRLHGGTVHVEDADPGARFVVHLPAQGPGADVVSRSTEPPAP